MPQFVIAMASKIRTCLECHLGLMKHPDPPRSGDWDEEGFLDFFCTECGISYPKIIIMASGLKTKQYSNRFVKKILKIVCNRGITFNYNVFSVLYGSLQAKNFYSPDDLAQTIIGKADENGVKLGYDFIIDTICYEEGNHPLN